MTVPFAICRGRGSMVVRSRNFSSCQVLIKVGIGRKRLKSVKTLNVASIGHLRSGFSSRRNVLTALSSGILVHTRNVARGNEQGTYYKRSVCAQRGGRSHPTPSHVAIGKTNACEPFVPVELPIWRQ